VPSALLLILGGDIPGLVAVTPASAAAAKSAYAMTDPDKVTFFKRGRHICMFTQNDPLTSTAGPITHLGGTQSAAYAINDTGQIVASGSNAQDQERIPAHIQLLTASRTYHPLA
jgi:uncharacterized membrane protein